MADYFQPRNPWLEAGQLGQGIGQGIQGAMMQIPQAQANARLMQQEYLRNQLQMQQAQQEFPLRQQLTQAQVGEAGARTGQAQAETELTKLQTQGLSRNERAHVDLGMHLATFVKEALTSGGNVSPQTAANVAQAMATADKVDPNLFPSLMTEMSSVVGKVGQNPALAQAMLTGDKMRTPVAPGSTLVDTYNPQNQPFTAPFPMAKAASSLGTTAAAYIRQHPDATPEEIGAALDEILPHMGRDQTTSQPMQPQGSPFASGGPSLQDILSGTLQRLDAPVTRIGQPGQAQGQPQKVSSQQEYDALPDGALFVDDSGHVKRKGQR